mmetsp:Transcript_33733/g.100619  ORF Transcript_33733/g.100619 Transcript_33733/m.100619 type:complete len:276 (-) Transcript_33733:443-1270(-)
MRRRALPAWGEGTSPFRSSAPYQSFSLSARGAASAHASSASMVRYPASRRRSRSRLPPAPLPPRPPTLVAFPLADSSLAPSPPRTSPSLPPPPSRSASRLDSGASPRTAVCPWNSTNPISFRRAFRVHGKVMREWARLRDLRTISSTFGGGLAAATSAPPPPPPAASKFRARARGGGGGGGSRGGINTRVRHATMNGRNRWFAFDFFLSGGRYASHLIRTHAASAFRASPPMATPRPSLPLNHILVHFLSSLTARVTSSPSQNIRRFWRGSFEAA